jgi:hypothetical protein
MCKEEPKNDKKPLYFWVSKEIPNKKEFFTHMNLVKHNGINHDPYQHGMMYWDEYVDLCYQKSKNESRELQVVYFDPSLNTMQSVQQRIQERVPNFLDFFDEFREIQTTTDVFNKISSDKKLNKKE